MKNPLNHLVIGLLLIITTSTLTYAITQTDFPDVDSNEWYADGINYVSDAQLMTGYENGDFGPENQVLRAELATILQRFDERTLASQTANFTNVLCDLGKRVKLYEDPTKKQILYGVSDFSSGYVEDTFLYNDTGERVGSIYRTDVAGGANTCTLNGESICASLQNLICEGTEESDF